MGFGHTTESNDLDVRNAGNFDTEPAASPWEQSGSIERDQRAIGNKAIRSPEYIPNPNANTEIAPPPKLGDIVNVTMPLNSANDSEGSKQFDPTSLNPNIIKFIDPNSIKEEGGKAPAHVIQAMDQIQDKFNKREIPLDELPELRNDLIGEYLHGSFNRKTVLKKISHKEAAW